MTNYKCRRHNRPVTYQRTFLCINPDFEAVAVKSIFFPLFGATLILVCSLNLSKTQQFDANSYSN
jgi:hypothetical protein